MKNLIFIVALLLLVSIAGCSSGVDTKNIKTIPPETPTQKHSSTNSAINEIVSQDDTPQVEETLENVQWISPGKVNVSNFHVGATAEYHITIHNGVSKQGNAIVLDPIFLKVTTDPDETVAEIPLNYKFYGSYKEIQIYSDNPKDNLRVVGGGDDGTAITISGFSPDDTRTMTLGYLQYATFAVKYRTADHALDGYKKAPKDLVEDWVIIADASPVFEPWETRNIAITLAMPDDIGPADTAFYEITNKGSSRLNAIAKEQVTILEQHYLSENREYQPTADIDVKRKLEESAKIDASKNVIEYIDNEIPEASLLLFLNKNSSVSEKLILSKDYSIDLLDYITQQGYAVKGDLLIDDWEFWISVMDATKQQQVATEMCSRWLISMR